MADHLEKERRRFPRVTVPSTPGSTGGLIPASLQEHSGEPLAQSVVRDGNMKTAAALREPVLRLVRVAGLGLAVWGGVTFVAVRVVLIGAAWATGRSGDAVTT
jgi:hypothetical protein